MLAPASPLRQRGEAPVGGDAGGSGSSATTRALNRANPLAALPRRPVPRRAARWS